MHHREPRIDALVRHAAHISGSRSGDADVVGRDRDALALGASMFVLPAIWLLAGVDIGDVDLATFVLVTLAYAAASTVEFEVGTAAAVPTEPLLVVMLVLLPAGLVPAAAFIGLGLGSAAIRVRHGRSEPLLATACSAVHAVGPALVVGAIGLGPPGALESSARLWLVLGAALASQLLGDLACSWVRNSWGLGVGVRELAAMLWWSFRVDLLLAPIGLAAALAFPSGPIAVVVAAAPLLLLAMLAHDRRGQIDGLLALSDAFGDASDRARRDPLTGLGNRLAWDEAVASAESGDREVGVIMLDVDWLKVVNDDFGHEAGDRLLRVVAGVIAAVAPDGAVVCRLGGDEFGVLLVGDDPASVDRTSVDRASVDRTAGFIRAGLAACPPIHGTAVSASIGTASTAGTPGTLGTRTTLGEALQAADRDVYRHKAARGRSRSRPRSSRAGAQVRDADSPMGHADTGGPSTRAEA